MNELLIPAILAVVAAWDIGRRYVAVQKHNEALLEQIRCTERLVGDTLRSLTDRSASAMDLEVATYTKLGERLTSLEGEVRGVKNRVASAEATAGTKPRGWSHGRAVKIG